MTKTFDPLDGIVTLWTSARKGYAREMIEVGNLLRQYLVDLLRAGEGMTEEQRMKANIRREVYTQAAATRLGVIRQKINELIRTSAVVELLSDKGYTGNLSYGAIRWFRALIQRRRGCVKRTLTDDGLTLVEREEWVIKISGSTNLFRKAVNENWNEPTVRENVKALAGTTRKPTALVIRKGQTQPMRTDLLGKRPTMDLAASIKGASPRDAADIIVDLIKGSISPDALAQAIRDKLSPVQPRLRVFSSSQER